MQISVELFQSFCLPSHQKLFCTICFTKGMRIPICGITWSIFPYCSFFPFHPNTILINTIMIIWLSWIPIQVFCYLMTLLPSPNTLKDFCSLAKVHSFSYLLLFFQSVQSNIVYLYSTIHRSYPLLLQQLPLPSIHYDTNKTEIV